VCAEHRVWLLRLGTTAPILFANLARQLAAQGLESQLPALPPQTDYAVLALLAPVGMMDCLWPVKAVGQHAPLAQDRALVVQSRLTDSVEPLALLEPHGTQALISAARPAHHPAPPELVQMSWVVALAPSQPTLIVQIV